MSKFTHKEYCELIENKLKVYMDFGTFPQKRVYDAMSYSLQAGGKRIRPVLVLEFCRLNGGDIYKALPIACAIEMLHTFSLIHDDLPCMDNDDLRRGRASCHKAYDEATALLAGDALAVYPFEVITGSVEENGNDLKAVIRVIKDISHAIGVMGMIGGQQIDVEYEGRRIDEQTLREMYRMKTSALLETSCRCGAIMAGADENRIKSAEEYAKRIGLAFQIVDDILDIEGDEKLLGKPIGSDSGNDKHTLVTVMGIEKAKELAAKLTDEALEIISDYNDNHFLTELTKNLLIRNK